MILAISSSTIQIITSDGSHDNHVHFWPIASAWDFGEVSASANNGHIQPFTWVLPKDSFCIESVRKAF
jgi:hypothetical protein